MTESNAHFTFATALLEPLIAHQGRKPILAGRVLAQSGGCAFIDLVVIPVGSEIGVHTHDKGDQEIYVIIDGQGQMLVDGVIHKVATGDVVVNRPGGSHALENTGESPLRLVVIDIA